MKRNRKNKESKSKISIHSPKKSNERKEALMRILVLIVSGIILGVWYYFVLVLGIVNFFYTLFKAKRMRGLADMSETWNTQSYIFRRYMIFLDNRRPFPFGNLERNIGEFEK